MAVFSLNYDSTEIIVHQVLPTGSGLIKRTSSSGCVVHDWEDLGWIFLGVGDVRVL